MSGKINGNGGFGEILRRVRAGSTPAAEASAAQGGASATISGDQNLIGAGSASRLSLAAGLPEAAAATPQDMVARSRDLNDLIQKVVGNEFPGLKLSPLKAAEMAQFIRSNLEAKGINDQAFSETQQNLG